MEFPFKREATTKKEIPPFGGISFKSSAKLRLKKSLWIFLI